MACVGGCFAVWPKMAVLAAQDDQGMWGGANGRAGAHALLIKGLTVPEGAVKRAI